MIYHYKFYLYSIQIKIELIQCFMDVSLFNIIPFILYIKKWEDKLLHFKSMIYLFRLDKLIKKQNNISRKFNYKKHHKQN